MLKYRKKVVDEIEFDIDDEDEIILLKQPYDTVMSVGHSDMLNHLQTTFLARRSDIIVSSTLSITLTPKDDEFIPTSFARIENDEITDWVNLRQEFRALQVRNARLEDRVKRKK